MRAFQQWQASQELDRSSTMSPQRRIWLAWLKIGRAINNVIARILLTVFYYTVFLPFGIGVRLLSDRLDLRLKRAQGWKARQRQPVNFESLRRMS